MKIHQEKLSDVSRYLEKKKDIDVEDKEQDFDDFFRHIKFYKAITPDTQILEIGTGTGWVQVLCKKKGLSCKGLEISQQLVEYAKEYGKKCGVVPDIELGNIEEADIGKAYYDIIIAYSSFEHVELWQKGLKKVYEALKPGGLFYFTSTNKFALKSGEYNFPLYGWLPDAWRYRLRIARQGPDIMKLGIDFNQFTYVQLRRFFKETGFSTVMDRIDFVHPNNLSDSKPSRKFILTLLKRFTLLKHLALTFSGDTAFICIK